MGFIFCMQINIRVSTSWNLLFVMEVVDMSKVPKIGSSKYYCIILKNCCHSFCVLLWCKTYRYFMEVQSYLLLLVADGLNSSFLTSNIAEWTVANRAILIYKGPRRGKVVENYRPIVYLNLIWKLATGIIAEKLQGDLDQQNLLPDEQKDCRCRSQRTKDQLLIKAVISNSKRRKTNLNVAWIDFKKAYIVLHVGPFWSQSRLHSNWFFSFCCN